MKTRSKVIMAVEITSDWLKMVVSQGYLSRGKIRGIFSKKITGLTDEEIARTIVECLGPRARKLKCVHVSLPRENVSVRFLKLPSQDNAELKVMTEFQAMRQVPYAKEEIVWDYQVVGKDAEGYSRVMLTIVHGGVVERYVKILSAAGFEPELVKLSSQAISDAYVSMCGIPDGIIALVDIDAASITLVILKGQDILTTRSMALALGEGEDLKGWREKLIDEIKRTLLAYRDEEPELEKPKKIMILGARSAISAELANVLAESLGIKVESENLMERVKTSGAAEPQKKALPSSLSFSGVLGLTSERSMTGINLLLPEIQGRRAQRKKLREIFISSALLTSMLIMGGLFLFRQVSFRHKMHRKLEAKISEYKAEALELEKMQGKLRAIKDRENARGMCALLLRELFRVVPDGVSLNTFVYAQGKPLVLKGSAKSIADVFKLVFLLEDSPYFMKAKSRSASMRKVGARELADFEINAELEKK